MLKTLQMGTVRLVVNTDHMDWNKRAVISDGLVEVKMKNSLFSKHPLQDGEDLKAWEERIKPEIEKTSGRLKKETSHEYLTKLMKGDTTKADLLFDTMVLIGKTFDQADKVTRENFNQAPYPACKAYIKELLDLYDLDASAFE